MTDRIFVDTNILIYAHDSDAEMKNAVASQMVEELWQTHLGVISAQVLQEFYVNITTKIPKPLPKAQASIYVERYFVWPVIRLSTETIRKAFEIERHNKVSFWDAMIVSAAFQAGAATILSEDLNAGQKIAGIKIVNPFA
jgi:predicted nucleic acid-binding protein